MARHTKDMSGATLDHGIAMPVDELRGRAVWTESGDRVGTLKNFRTDSDGRIVSLDVRHGWMFGHHHEVDASSMRMEGGDVVVPASAVSPRDGERRTPSDADATATATAMPRTGHGTSPVLLAGRSGARSRYGGLDPAAGLIGALAAIASFVLLGGLLAALFDTDVLSLDTGATSWDVLTSTPVLVGAAALALSLFIGGWAAGRSARFDGARNGMSVVGWLLLIGALFAVAGAVFGEKYDLFSSSSLPNVDWNDVGTAGLIGLLAGLAIMLVSSALGGALGSMRNRRIDRHMLDVVQVGPEGGRDDRSRGHSTVASDRTYVAPDTNRVDHTDRVGDSADDDRVVDAGDTMVVDRDANRLDQSRRDTGVVGTPTGSPFTARTQPTSDSPDDVTRPR